MVKKTILFFNIILIILTFSCKKAETEIILTNKAPAITIEKETDHSILNETKPLINIGLNDTLEIYVRADGAPGMYLDGHGVLKGFYVELEEAIMDKMGQKYKMHPYSDAGPVVQMIKDGSAHSAIVVPDLPDYRTFVNLSIPYEVLKYVTVVKGNDTTEYTTNKKEDIIKSFYGKNIGVQTRGHVYQALRGYKDITLIEYPTTTIAMEALSEGKVDAVPEVKRIMKYYSKLNGWDLKVVGEPILSYNITTGFSKTLNKEILTRYNTALKSLIDTGYVDNLYFEYFGE